MFLPCLDVTICGDRVALLAGRALLSFTLLVMATGPAQAQPASTDFQRIKQAGVLRWGADASGGEPFVFPDKRDVDQVTGFEVDIVNKLAAHLGVRAEFIQGDWPTLIPSLEIKHIDLMLNGLELKDRPAAKVRYTVPYFQYVQQITVRAADKDKYKSLNDLQGKAIAVLNASASVDVLNKAGWPDGLIKQFDDSLKPYEVLRDQRVEAVLAESIIAKVYAGQDQAFFNLPETFAPGFYVGAVRGDDVELLKEINFALETMKHNGELAAIYQKWGVYNERQAQLGIYTRLSKEEGPNQSAGDTGWRSLALALGRATAVTLLLTATSMPLALIFGLGLALMCRSGNELLARPAQIYIQVMRGTPLLVQIFVIFFTLPRIGELLGTGMLTWPPELVGILCLSANYAAYEAEIHRAGLDAVPRGQREAALSLGMSERQAFFIVVLPQSFRIILPPVLNDVISMLKDSSLVSVIGVGELLFVASSTGKATFLYAQMLMVAALIYLALSLFADFAGKRVEVFFKQRGSPRVAGNPAHH